VPRVHSRGDDPDRARHQVPVLKRLDAMPADEEMTFSWGEWVELTGYDEATHSYRPSAT